MMDTIRQEPFTVITDIGGSLSKAIDIYLEATAQRLAGKGATVDASGPPPKAAPAATPEAAAAQAKESASAQATQQEEDSLGLLVVLGSFAALMLTFGGKRK